MKLYKIVFLCLLVTFSISCKHGIEKKNGSVQPEVRNKVLSGSISISGAFALNPLAQKWADDFMKIHPGVKIEVNKTGTGLAIKDLISGKCQIALISRPLSDEEITAGVWVLPVAKDGVAPIISKRNPYLGRLLRRGLSVAEFSKIFTGDNTVTWGEVLDTVAKEKVISFIREEESGAADVWADFLYKQSSDLKGRKVTGDDEMIKSVRENPFSIGFCNFSYAFDLTTGEQVSDIQIVPFDLNFDHKIAGREIPFGNLEKAHRALWLGLYPKNLCRELTIGTKGKPTDNLIIEFLKYTLAKGQEDVKIVGLCNLNNVYIQYASDRLK